MHGERDTSTSNTGAKIDMEDLEHGVSSYIGEYEEELVISDIFVFENSDYYFSIMEEDTGMGAMELLVNPYTGEIYPEFGPNMMWNLKYGMHGSGGRGMMGRGMMGNGMMGGRVDNDSFSSDDVERNTISIKDAKAQQRSTLQAGLTILTRCRVKDTSSTATTHSTLSKTAKRLG